MSTQHPITPPEELLEHWDIVSKLGNSRNALTLAYRAGADQELEACYGWVEGSISTQEAAELRAARRPKPPSLKEQALGALGRFNTNTHTRADEMTQDFDLIRRALEALSND